MHHIFLVCTLNRGEFTIFKLRYILEGIDIYIWRHQLRKNSRDKDPKPQQEFCLAKCQQLTCDLDWNIKALINRF